MADRARVSSVEALAAFRPALVKFQEETAAALTSAESDAGRTALKLRNQLEPYWKKECRVRREELTRAKGKVSAKQASKSNDERTTVDEKKALEKAKRRLEYAERKLEVTRVWARRLEKEQDEFRSKIGGFKAVVDQQMPRAVFELDRVIRTLDEYLRIKSKAGDAPVPEKTEGGEG